MTRDCQSLIWFCNLFTSYWLTWLFYLWVWSSCLLTNYSSLSYRSSIYTFLAFYLFNYSFCPEMINFWSRMIYSHRLILSLNPSIYILFSLWILLPRSAFVELWCILLLISIILEASILVLFRADSLILSFSCIY